MAMFGSQALETAIGMATLFFVLATTASVICEVISRWFGKRSKDLERCIGALLSGIDVKTAKDTADPKYQEALDQVKKTSVWAAAEAAAGKSLWRRGKSKGPSYLSAKSFADAVVEYIATTTPKDGTVSSAWPEKLRIRLETMVAEGRDDLVEVKAGLETWFDESMARAQGSYKRWATAVLFAVGLALAGAGNVSAMHAAQSLWADPVARVVLNDAAEKYVADAATTPNDTAVESIGKATDLVAKVGFPVGWNAQAKAVWVDQGDLRIADSWAATRTQVSLLLGWLVTALLIMLGGPFWFDLLTRLMAVRGTGAKPDPAATDTSSATSALTVASPAAARASTKKLDLVTGIVDK